jgi:hypothetical protein
VSLIIYIFGGSVVIYLYHYFERKVGPFVSLSGLQVEEAMKIQALLNIKNKTFHAGKRSEKYYERRKYLEQLVRTLFIEKGGQPIRETPHYGMFFFYPLIFHSFHIITSLLQRN